ncbi:MAG: aldose 1-epimerase family protein [Oscillospiraceae bacterium]|nr:aldose 1-epimerase family protein [Oscillospiraceae bacterium]
MQKILNYGKVYGIVDTMGGELISYKNDGKEYLWTGLSEYWASHTPVLFPTVGVCKDEKVIIEGGEYSLKRHGFARKSEFILKEITDDTAVFELLYSDETLKQYPYKFSLTVTHKINESGFRTEYNVENLDDKEIMFAIGGHPGFLLDSIENYKLIFETKENCKMYYTDSNSCMDENLLHAKKLENTDVFELVYSDYDTDAIVIKDLKSRKVKLVSKFSGSGIEFDYNGFDVLGIWTPPKKNAPFICLEPWNGMPAYANETGKFEDKPYIKKLNVGESYSVGYTVTICR